METLELLKIIETKGTQIQLLATNDDWNGVALEQTSLVELLEVLPNVKSPDLSVAMRNRIKLALSQLAGQISFANNRAHNSKQDIAQLIDALPPSK